MKRMLQAALAAATLAATAQATAQVTFYAQEGMRGQAVTIDRPVGRFERYGFDDRASSVLVQGGWWEVCEEPRFEGRCAILRPGAYPSLREAGFNNQISSARPVEPGGRHNGRGAGRGWGPPPHAQGHPHDPAPMYGMAQPQPVPQPVPLPPGPVVLQPAPALYDVPVNSARAVYGQAQQRCWVERERVNQTGYSGPNLGGAILGGVIGGVLGHQVGGGSGRDAATGIGAVAGAAIGANAGRSAAGVPVDREVQRCQAVPQAQPAYWDVSYQFAGVEHRVQMSAQPGPTIRVNAQGAPV